MALGYPKLDRAEGNLWWRRRSAGSLSPAHSSVPTQEDQCVITAVSPHEGCDESARGIWREAAIAPISSDRGQRGGHPMLTSVLGAPECQRALGSGPRLGTWRTAAGIDRRGISGRWGVPAYSIGGNRKRGWPPRPARGSSKRSPVQRGA